MFLLVVMVFLNAAILELIVATFPKLLIPDFMIFGVLMVVVGLPTIHFFERRFSSEQGFMTPTIYSMKTMLIMSIAVLVTILIVFPLLFVGLSLVEMKRAGETVGVFGFFSNVFKYFSLRELIVTAFGAAAAVFVVTITSNLLGIRSK